MDLLGLANALLAEAESHNAPERIQQIPISNQYQEPGYRAVEWIREAYRRVQQERTDWTFHYVDGTLLTTDGTNSDYEVENVRTVDRDFLLCRQQGGTGTWPLLWVDWDAWKRMFDNSWLQMSSGVPSWITRMPNGKFRLTPAPDSTIYEVLGKWYRTNHELQTAEDEPLWDEEFHRLLVWEAARSYAEEYEAAPLAGRIQQNLPRMRQAFFNRFASEAW